MTGWDVAQAILDLIAANAGTLNANPRLAATHWSVRTDPEDAEGSADPFKYLKLDDRDAFPDGLNITVTFGTDRTVREFSGWMAHKEATCYIVCYFAGATAADGVGVVDPSLLVAAKRGIAEGLTSLLGRRELRVSLPTGAGTVWNGRITETAYTMAPKPSMGVFVPMLQLTYTGLYATQATEMDGAESAG